MYCQKCGSEIPDNAAFCMKCGDRIVAQGNCSKSIIDTSKVEAGNVAISETKYNKKIKFFLLAVVLVTVIGIGIKCSRSMMLKNYKSAPDIDIIATNVKDGEGYFVIKNTGDNVIKDLTLTAVGYDESGNAINLGGQTLYKSYDFPTVNILPDTVFGLDDYVLLNPSVKYMDIAVTSITYKDGSTWSTEGLEAWAKNVSETFSAESYKQKIENMKSDAILAENNPYVKITKMDKYSDNKFSNSDDLDISAENIGERAIHKINIIIMEYDSNGYAVSVSPFEFAVQNAKVATIDTANMDSGLTGSWNWSLFFESNCRSFKALVYAIEFKDGTTWKNEYALPWMLYNEDER